ncbi:hypothetical protein VL4N_12570 [Vagococcus lutrae]|uniref:leucine-rich repeat domain-containing protein n=1 Tax=Vagococcus lutrae TaxID=81947 RepID=UPI0019259447|nr:leucine-rich repeat domain-containing protein [Vagococcus lutrae]GEQ61883.1 hypothetical protein VL2N_12190 [Vagococcus lutrae]GEQ63816.1 hypothetical protein VL3N_12580 [Vagococcus lutrae]GEQ65707.1 hypothetical protein VL4N_12570 [Vagococcus lutrae]
MKKTIITSLIISGLFISHNVLATEVTTDLAEQSADVSELIVPETSSLEIGHVFTDQQGVIYKITSIDGGRGDVQVGDGENPIPNLASHIQIPETLDFGGVTFTVKQIGSFAFTKYQDEGGAIAEGGSNVEIIELPRTITTIQPKAFYSSLDLRLIHFTPDSQLTTIGKDAFAFSGLSKISIPDSVVEIGANAFVFNEFLTEFQLSDTSSLQVIGDGALRTTRQLKHIYLPASLISIGERPFSGAIGLQSISVSPENPNYSSIDGVLFDKTQETLITYPADHDDHSYTVPETVTTIDDYAFEYDVNLKSLTLSDSVRHVGDLAFKNMRKLETLHLNEGLTSVGRLAFYGINQLKELTLPNSLTEYGRNPLYELDGLEQITIGTGTTHLPANFLGGPFTQLHTITILGDEVTFDEDMFSFFDSTNWQNLKFFVTNENVRQRLLDTLTIEKEQVKVLESLPEAPVTPTEPDETHDVEQTEKETGTQTETPTLPNEDKEDQPQEETQKKPEKEQDDNNTPKPDTNIPLKNEVDEHTTLSSSPNNQVDVSVIHAEQQEHAKKAAHSSQRLPQTSEDKKSNLLLVIGSTLSTTAAIIFYKKH